MHRLVVNLRLAGPVAAGLAISLVATVASAQTFSVAPGGPSGLASEFIYENIGGVPTPVACGPACGLGPGDVIDGFSDDKDLIEFREIPGERNTLMCKSRVLMSAILLAIRADTSRTRAAL